MEIGKLFLGVLLTFIVVVLLPFLLARFALIPELNGAAWYILLVTAGGLSLKTLFADSAGNKLQWSKVGNDYCTIAFGGVLTSFAIQIVSHTDLFPGIGNITVIKDIPAFSKSASANRSAQLMVALILAMIFMFFAAKISASIKAAEAKGRERPTLSLLNGVLGATLLGSYALILISKG